MSPELKQELVIPTNSYPTEIMGFDFKTSKDSEIPRDSKLSSHTGYPNHVYKKGTKKIKKDRA